MIAQPTKKAERRDEHGDESVTRTSSISIITSEMTIESTPEMN